MHRHGAQPHPGNHLVSFHSYFIGLNMHQVKLPLLDDLLMDLLAMLSCSVTPGCHRPLIQPEGMHNRLDRASIRQERYHDHNQLHGFAQPLKHRSLTGAERLFADRTAIALSFAIMDRDLARTSLASCRTHRIRAKYVRRVHWLGCTFLHKHIMPGTVTFFNSFSLHRVMGSYHSSASPWLSMKWRSTLLVWDVASGAGYYQNLCIVILDFWRACFLQAPLGLVPVIIDTLPTYFCFPCACSWYGLQQLSFSEVLLSAFSLWERFYRHSASIYLAQQCLSMFDFAMRL